MKLLRDYLEREVAKRSFPGVVVGVWHKGKRYFVSAGHETYGGEVSVTECSVYDVASVTKAIPTACLAIRLASEGRLNFDDLLISVVPEFNSQYRQQVTIGMLIRQELDYAVRLSSLKGGTANEIMGAVLAAQLLNPPATRVFHSNPSSILLTEVIRRVTGGELDALADRYFFQPLGLGGTTFYPSKAVPTEKGVFASRVIHDESAALLREKMVAGSAGLFSTAQDLLTFLEALILGNGFSESELSLMEQGYGWEVARDFMGKGAGEKTIAKRGFTGCMVLLDRGHELGVVMLSNTVYPKRRELEEHQNLNHRLRTEVMNIIWESL